MKSFIFLVLIALISLVLSFPRQRTCTKENGKETCCWWNSNGCCKRTSPRQICTMAIKRCCETHDIELPIEDDDYIQTKDEIQKE